VQQAGLDKLNWDIKNLQSQIKDRAEKLNLDRQTTQANVAEKLSAIQQRLTDIPDGAMKLINESATQSATSKQAATQYNDLAKRIESAEGGKGRLTSAAEWFAAQTGQQDAWTQIRNEYTRIRNTVAIKSLPPGPATDSDIQLALKGIPPETANAATLASFLRGTAKLQDIDSAISNAKTDWLSQNKGVLTRAKTPFIAGDYAAKPGETFNDFAQRIVVDVSAKYRPAEQVAEERRQQLISQIPTNQAPAAAAPSSSIEAQADAIIRGGR
jgi:polyhydroxyalkanoate synthesis regulator phasin